MRRHDRLTSRAVPPSPVHLQPAWSHQLMFSLRRTRATTTFAFRIVLCILLRGTSRSFFPVAWFSSLLEAHCSCCCCGGCTCWRQLRGTVCPVQSVIQLVCSLIVVFVCSQKRLPLALFARRTKVACENILQLVQNLRSLMPGLPTCWPFFFAFYSVGFFLAPNWAVARELSAVEGTCKVVNGQSWVHCRTGLCCFCCTLLFKDAFGIAWQHCCCCMLVCVLYEPCFLELCTSRVPCLYKKNCCCRRVSRHLAVPWMLSARVCRPLCAACAYHKRDGVCHMYATHRRSPWGVALKGPSLLSESAPVSYNLWPCHDQCSEQRC